MSSFRSCSAYTTVLHLTLKKVFFFDRKGYVNEFVFSLPALLERKFLFPTFSVDFVNKKTSWVSRGGEMLKNFSTSGSISGLGTLFRPEVVGGGGVMRTSRDNHLS